MLQNVHLFVPLYLYDTVYFPLKNNTSGNSCITDTAVSRKARLCNKALKIKINYAPDFTISEIHK